MYNNHAVCWHQAVVALCHVELLEDLHGSCTPIQSTSRHAMIPRKIMHQAVNVLTLKTLLMPGSEKQPLTEHNSSSFLGM